MKTAIRAILKGGASSQQGVEQRPSRHVDVQGRNQGPF